MADETTAKARKQKSANAPASKHSLTIQFTEPEDLELYDRLVELAKADFRRPLDQYVLLSLHTAFKQPAEVEDFEVEGA